VSAQPSHREPPRVELTVSYEVDAHDVTTQQCDHPSWAPGLPLGNAGVTRREVASLGTEFAGPDAPSRHHRSPGNAPARHFRAAPKVGADVWQPSGTSL